MEKVLSFFGCLLLVATVNCQRNRGEGPCFHFEGNGFLHFSPNNFHNEGSMHYKLKFRTTNENGILLHSRGVNGDHETLYVRDGRLHYHLFNTSPYGLGRFFGGPFVGTEMVNTGDWVEVHVYRICEDTTSRRTRHKTGISMKVGNGDMQSFVDYRPREGIDLSSTISVGGNRSPLSSTVGFFEGDIKDIRAKKSIERIFEEPTLNFRSRVTNDCSADLIIDGPEPQ